MTELFLDTETYSTIPIKHGVSRYSEGVEVMVFAYAFDDNPVTVLDLANSDAIPEDVIAALKSPLIEKVMHNSYFDRTVLREALGLYIPVEQIHDTMAQALCHGLPGALGTLCDIYGLGDDEAKDKEGRSLINLFCKPRPKNMKLRRATKGTNPKEWDHFLRYAGGDITAMRILKRKLPMWNYRRRDDVNPLGQGCDRRLWELDQHINDRGFRVDTALAGAAIDAIVAAQKELTQRTKEITLEEVERTTQRDKMLKYILEYYGVDLPDLQKDTIERRINDPDLPLPVRELLAIRQEASLSSTGKYKKILECVSEDGRVRGALQYSGAARTRRWAGRMVQPQNLPRPAHSAEQIEQGIAAMKAGCLDMVEENPIRMASSCIRGAIIPSDGRKLVVSDLANIEGRGAAWLAGEEWKLDAFRAYDAETGPDLYKVAYARAFDTTPEKVGKDERQIGKVMELACLAGDTRILTDNGIKAMLDLSTEDEVWDGVEWVKHAGLVVRGVKPVVNVVGIEVTPDHLMLIGKTWYPVSHIVSNENMLSRALATGSERIPLWDIISVMLAGLFRSEFNALAVVRNIMFFLIIYLKGRVGRAEDALRKKPVTGVKSTMDTRILCRTRTTELDFSDVSLLASTDAQTQAMPGLKTMGVGVSRCSLNGLGIVKHSCNTLLRWLGGINPTLNLIALTWIRGMNRVISVLLRKLKTKETGVRLSLCNGESNTSKSVYDVADAGPRNRFTIISDEGPLVVHNCGYGGGVGAFFTMSTAYNLDLDDMASKALPLVPSGIMRDSLGFYDWTVSKRRSTFGLSKDAFVACEALKRMWREAHPAISSFWKDLETSAARALRTPGVGVPCRKVTMVKLGSWLRVILPSGHSLCYASPRIDDGALSYMGMSTYSRKWGRQKTYGGKILENATQSISRDVMAYNMPLVESEGYSTLLTVHDELITEAPDLPRFNAEHLSKLMSAPPSWAEGFPLAAGGFEAYRYRKD